MNRTNTEITKVNAKGGMYDRNMNRVKVLTRGKDNGLPAIVVVLHRRRRATGPAL